MFLSRKPNRVISKISMKICVIYVTNLVILRIIVYYAEQPIKIQQVESNGEENLNLVNIRQKVRTK